MNDMYRERFPNAISQMEDKLSEFLSTNGGVITPSATSTAIAGKLLLPEQLQYSLTDLIIALARASVLVIGNHAFFIWSTIPTNLWEVDLDLL